MRDILQHRRCQLGVQRAEQAQAATAGKRDLEAGGARHARTVGELITLQSRSIQLMADANSTRGRQVTTMITNACTSTMTTCVYSQKMWTAPWPIALSSDPPPRQIKRTPLHPYSNAQLLAPSNSRPSLLRLHLEVLDTLSNLGRGRLDAIGSRGAIRGAVRLLLLLLVLR